MTTQMQHLLNRSNEELYKQIEGLEHQMNPNGRRPYGGNKRVSDGMNRIEGQDKIEGVKLNVPLFRGKSDPDSYLDWEMKIQHAFSCNDYPEEQKVKLAAAHLQRLTSRSAGGQRRARQNRRSGAAFVEQRGAGRHGRRNAGTFATTRRACSERLTPSGLRALAAPETPTAPRRVRSPHPWLRL